MHENTLLALIAELSAARNALLNAQVLAGHDDEHLTAALDAITRQLTTQLRVLVASHGGQRS